MLGSGTTEVFFEEEFRELSLGDKRLKRRALQIYGALQRRLTSCMKRLFMNSNDLRQAYDFF